MADETPVALTKKKSSAARKKNGLVKRDAERLVRELTAEMAPELVQRVAEKLDLDPGEALELIHMNKLDKAVNRSLIDSVTTGAMYNKAMGKMLEAVDDGKEWAIKMVIETNKAFDKSPQKMVQNLALHKHDHNNTFLTQAAEAEKLLNKESQD